MNRSFLRITEFPTTQETDLSLLSLVATFPLLLTICTFPKLLVPYIDLDVFPMSLLILFSLARKYFQGTLCVQIPLFL